MSQADAGAAALGSLKMGGKAMLADLAKDGGAVEIEMRTLAETAPELLKALELVLEPVIKVALKNLAEKL